MNNTVKIGLYVVLTTGAIVFGYLAFSNYEKLMSQTADTEAAPLDVPALTVGEPRSEGYSKVIGYGGVFFLFIACLGVLFGHDISHLLGTKALKFIYNEEGVGAGDVEYEKAEEEWANSNFLEAIQLMREYLKKHPREQHVALRIGEIYEKDMNNPLAAALEYEEVLKHRLPADRWGWAAIHLCNLYFRLNQQDKAVELLRRIVAEYGNTAAAEKARKRLDQMGLSAPERAEEEESASEPAQEESRPSNLPPGFSIKKE